MTFSVAPARGTSMTATPVDTETVFNNVNHAPTTPEHGRRTAYNW